MSNAQFTFVSLAHNLPVRAAAPTVVAGVSVANMTSAQASIALAIEAALKGRK